MEITLAEAIQKLRDELKKDQSQGSYFYGWQSNLAMSFVDVFNKKLCGQDQIVSSATLYKVSNDAAISFLSKIMNTGIKNIEPMYDEKTINGKSIKYSAVIHHVTVSRLSFWDRIRVLFGKSIRVSSNIYTLTPNVDIVASEASEEVEPLFKKKRRVISLSSTDYTNA